MIPRWKLTPSLSLTNCTVPNTKNTHTVGLFMSKIYNSSQDASGEVYMNMLRKYQKRCQEDRSVPRKSPVSVLYNNSAYETTRRTEFTKRDDKHLGAYIAKRIPRKEDGGRTGNVIYRELCNEVRRKISHSVTSDKTFLTRSTRNSIHGHPGTRGTRGGPDIRITKKISTTILKAIL